MIKETEVAKGSLKSTQDGESKIEEQNDSWSCLHLAWQEEDSTAMLSFPVTSHTPISTNHSDLITFATWRVNHDQILQALGSIASGCYSGRANCLQAGYRQ